MAELTDYSDKMQKVIKEAVANDKGFHSEYFIAEFPLSEMLLEDDKGLTFTQESATVAISSNSTNYNLLVRFSNEQNCWFFTISDGSEEFEGIVHFNTVYNAKSDFSFIFLNNNDSGEIYDITQSLPFTSVFIMRK